MSENQGENTIKPEYVLPEARVLLIGKLQYNIMQVKQFLNEKGIRTNCVFSLKDAVPQFTEFKPTHVFISVGFGNQKVDSFAKTFKESMGAIFYAFPEEKNKETELLIKTSMVENKMKLNITGGGVIRIVDTWLKEKWMALPPEVRKHRPVGKKVKKKQKVEGQKAVGSVVVLGSKQKKEPGTVKYMGGKAKKMEYKPKEKKEGFDGSSVGLAGLSAPNFEGYAIFLSDLELPLKPRELRELTEAFTKELKKHLEAQGKTIPENFEVTLKKLDISSESERFVEFLSPEDNGIKLIEGSDTPLEIAPSDEPDMISVDIERIDTSTPVDFDVFIRLAINQKYVKYVNEGDTMSEAQKEKLKKGNVAKVHIRKDDQSKFENYCTHVFLATALSQAS